ncbi:asparaginyl-tRNA synthetase [Trifolium pratense]|uniref:Asparaginyl-tRNA synthetase n=1 Tax=Trifolium pratense TaxID=57577 RepID=A0A2K3NKU5_TRIPR|nr:asparaginyl-tRNA synthetase [Trifolium pratense]
MSPAWLPRVLLCGCKELFVVKSQGTKQKVELKLNKLVLVARVRNALTYATHKFFQENGFVWVSSPIITASNCEGAGEQFCVTTLDFFGKPAFLTVSGQLNAETYATALSDVYTFGPTFRAENSNTSRHLAEFWMIETELAFADLNDDMACATAYLQFEIRHILDNCKEDMEFFNTWIDKGIIDRLSVKWGCDLQSEHDRYITEEAFGRCPVIIRDYPKACYFSPSFSVHYVQAADIKAFYMRQNDDGRTVAAMDMLVPKIGELIGGSQREERLDHLEARLDDLKLNKNAYWWYLDLRRYGSVPHAGFGLGFVRLVQFATGMDNIRDVIPFPRTPGSAEF